MLASNAELVETLQERRLQFEKTITAQHVKKGARSTWTTFQLRRLSTQVYVYTPLSFVGLARGCA